MQKNAPNKPLLKKLLLILLIGLGSFSIAAHTDLQGSSPNSGDFGAWSAIALAMVCLFLPLGYVSIFNVKVKNPQPLLIEPTPWKFFLRSFPYSVLAAVIVIAISLIEFFINNYIHVSSPVANFVGSFTTIFGLFFIVYAPMFVYMVYVKTRYERVVEYRSVEWLEINKSNKEARKQQKAQAKLNTPIVKAKFNLSRKKLGLMIIFAPIILFLIDIIIGSIFMPPSPNIDSMELIKSPILNFLFIGLSVLSAFAFIPCLIVGIVFIAKKKRSPQDEQERASSL